MSYWVGWPWLVGFAALLAVPTVAWFRRLWRLYAAPISKQLAYVVDAGGGTYVAHADHDREDEGQLVVDTTVTLEFEDGRRRRLVLEAGASGACTAGDVGLAFIQADALLAFYRLREPGVVETTPPRIAGAGEGER